MNVWWVAVDRKQDNSSYEELKERHAVAQGWPDLGDLWHLWKEDQGKISNAIAMMGSKYKDFPPPSLAFAYLLSTIESGDIVVAIEATRVRGIAEICPLTRYVYDRDGKVSGCDPTKWHQKRKDFEYAHCLFPVKWVDWEELGVGWKPQAPAQSVQGIRGVVDSKNEVVKVWEDYKKASGFKPCEGLEAQLKRLEQYIEDVRRRKMEEKLGILKALLEQHHQIVLQGPPGTGKTHSAKALAAFMLGFDPLAASNKEHEQHEGFNDRRFSDRKGVNGKGCWEIIQFHPAYNYEDFVRGIKVKTENNSIHYETKNRIFAEMCQEAAKEENKDKAFILIIDEINRAHLAAVMGELIYALEYRGEKVRTPYEVDGDATLMVPKNLYIIGAMNTADRSIGHIDYAVRRRFAFCSLLPEEDLLVEYYGGNKNHVALKMFQQVSGLFKNEDKTQARPLSPEFHPDDVQVGHTYFMAKTKEMAKAKEELFSKFIYQVYPLLREYYKDGILVKTGGEALKVLGVSLSSQEKADEILDKLKIQFPDQGAKEGEKEAQVDHPAGMGDGQETQPPANDPSATS